MNKLIFFYSIGFLLYMSCENPNNSINNSLESITTNIEEKKIKDSISTLTFGGTYSFGKDIEKEPVGAVIIYPITDSSALFYIDVSRGAPSYNSGQLFGKILFKNNIGYYNSTLDNKDLNCSLNFEFNNDKLKLTSNETKNNCGFGHAVFIDNTYTLINKTISEYYINGEGDTILFKDFK